MVHDLVPDDIMQLASERGRERVCVCVCVCQRWISMQEGDSLSMDNYLECL